MPIIEVTKANFKEKVLENDFAVVDFNADWCGPCKMLRPILEEVSNEENIDIYSVNIDDNEELAEEYEVSSIPCVVVFQDGKEVDRHIGMMSKKDVIKMIGAK